MARSGRGGGERVELSGEVEMLELVGMIESSSSGSERIGSAVIGWLAWGLSRASLRRKCPPTFSKYIHDHIKIIYSALTGQRSSMILYYRNTIYFGYRRPFLPKMLNHEDYDIFLPQPPKDAPRT